jgi:hypothetical protein
MSNYMPPTLISSELGEAESKYQIDLKTNAEGSYYVRGGIPIGETGASTLLLLRSKRRERKWPLGQLKEWLNASTNGATETGSARSPHGPAG